MMQTQKITRRFYNNKILLLLLFISICTTAVSQKKQSISQSASLTFGFASKTFTTAINYQYLWKFGNKQKWGMGAGIRLTNSFGNNQYYTTAPAKLTSGKTGPGVLFADDKPQNIDSVLFKKTQTNALNISVNFDYSINRKINIGFNIDAIGFTLGGNQSGNYFTNSGSGISTLAKPTSFNLLLVSDNDKGSLNSELYATYVIEKKWAAKIAFQYLFTEYTTATKIQTTPDGQTNDRFRAKAKGIAIGVLYSF
jgi:hypothetical protein